MNWSQLRQKSAFLGTFLNDFRASLVVFLVALPLCMGIALASGVPTEKAAAVGIITGIVGGLVVGFLAGSPLQVSGPAAGLSVLVFDFIRTHGFEKLGLVVLLAGAIQLAAGFLRWGQLFRAVSPAVIQGMLSGIGILIIASQFHIMLDHKVPGKHGYENLLAIPQSIIDSMGEDPTHRWAARIGITTIVVMILWSLLAPKKLRFIPAPLVGVIVASAESAFLQWDFPFLHISRVGMPGNLLEAVNMPTLASLQSLQEWGIWQAALTMAVIASAETLLCAAAVDKLHKGTRTKYDRELAAQGFGNMICGFLGVLPMTGVIVRSAANVDAGGKTRVSAILHGVWLLGFVALLPFVLELIPIASLAAILVLTGYKLTNPKAVRWLWQYGKGEVLIFASTVFVIVVVDLLAGVLVGVALSAVKLLYTFSRLSVRLEVDMEKKTAVLYLRGTATFIRLPKLAAALERVPPGVKLHVHLEHLNYIDHACLDLLMSWEKQHEDTGGSLVVDWDTLTARFRHPHKNLRERKTGETSTNGENGYFSKSLSPDHEPNQVLAEKEPARNSTIEM